ncbi:MAG: hypothetical protein F6K19_14950 [Cyanothece sp. SIO1E1]|nr:hypothetical protein [Cyanothece sp. SIO1E1]
MISKGLLIHKLPLAIIVIGSVARLNQYFYNRSLWSDEAALALNIVNRSYAELLEPLDYNQGAPIVFLLIQKFAVQLLGNNEYALRLIPLISGIIALFLICRLAKLWLLPKSIPLAMLLAVGLRQIIYFSTEVKQYSSDVAISLLSFFLAYQLVKSKLTLNQAVLLAAVGGVLVWCSHPAIFVLASVGFVSIVIGQYKHKHAHSIKLSILVLSAWLVSFAAFYLISLQTLGDNQDLVTSWQNVKRAFPSSPFDLLWVLDGLGRFFYKPLGFKGPWDGVAIIAFLAGCISLYRRQKLKLLILLSPVLTTLGAAYLHKYPFEGRLLLFLTPFFIILIAEGMSFVLEISPNRWAKFLSILLVIAIVLVPLEGVGRALTMPRWHDEIKPVMNYVKANQKPDDKLHVYRKGTEQFLYYAERYGYQEGDYVLGVEAIDGDNGRSELNPVQWEQYKQQLNTLQGHDRVWFLFAHAWINRENKLIKEYLDQIGTQLDSFESYESFVYLYDLS